jgi:4-hydroxy-4-methyl-2-oxoglutarate aldolase
VDTEAMAQQLSELGAATLGESGARRMRARIRSVWPGAVLAAPAFPVSCTPGDNLAVHVAVSRAPAGSALVVDVGRVPERGYWGEVLTTAAQSRDLVGLVIDGGVRDTAALHEHGFPVFSSTVSLPGATKMFPGTVGLSARVGGVDVRLGDWVVGDGDGVVVIAQDRVNEVLDAGRARANKEAEQFVRLESGSTTVELLGLDVTAIRDR